ncbi:spherulation-specific family 4 protein [Kitasatospora mediocidica]|uniref:spherulation-specific family 4 protein n=1 Tax=Kitasatospora mediocidica TaxID=58352 RepID=UPI00056D3670|nr:spherulation-specific family 4 protein [Kitasatospora mediocidica]
MRHLTKRLASLLIGGALTVAVGGSTAATADGRAGVGARGLEVAVPAYALPGSAMLTAALSASPAPAVVVLNPDSGDAPFDAAWQAQADALRGRTTAVGGRTKVLGYVNTSHGAPSLDDVEAVVDNYLRTADHRLHVDGIFFDQTGRDCGDADVTRNYYATLRSYVQEAVYRLDPDARDLVVDNPGTAVADCYLEADHRTADVFVTYEGSYADYTGGGWLGGNVFNDDAGYYSGAAFDPAGTSFWHLVDAVPDAAAMRTALDTAFTRGAGYAYATDDDLPDPWDSEPSWGFSSETSHAAALG